ncbi:MAG: ABC transporter substrate-binding protein [Chloroflexi bacterium]|jgi:iron complex transport system substrate-binding protein|uniref:ABC transporter substrate-binding protein n=1 Tax=Candidatus Thermofonsia Clade 3 bacterium TaxID=2364212 RepID=A0A2M8Q9Z7_9CHLR|nr:ABC transporter substrate-binding protein [Candidatus Roseilinea sp. NK_OTU-006]PJF46580.1 MAG: ABC transporter substrate-binding protein [Candidatus Thermofonsia Clade 3 bacterium]RMG61741.1 MAG: ABC transporter substrate-binding protein [Chloroflexota bacterium]
MSHTDTTVSTFHRLFVLSVLAAALTACAVPLPTPTAIPAQPTAAQEPTATPAPTATPEPQPTAAPAVEAPTTNLTDGCIETFSPDVDYFPEKVTLEDATGFTVEYFKHYKVVTVLNPWRGAEQQFRYVIVQCGAPAPTDVGDALVIEAPAQDVIAMSTTHLPHLEKLDLLDRLLGLDSFLYVNNPKVRALIEAGALMEIGSGAQVDVEKTIAAQPDLVMTYGSGDPQYDAHPKLLEAKIPTVINAEYMEETPLGRAEWIKFTALFFNKEAQAQEAYAATQQRYRAIAEKVKAATTRPVVIPNMAMQDKWIVPGGASYVAQLIRDAGGAYPFADDQSAGSLFLTFEEVYDKAVSADVWLLGSFERYDTIQAILAAEPRYAEMAAVKNGNVWNNDKRVNENGGNDYWETGVGNPDILLADLAKILHPDLMADHEFVFWRKLESK